MELRCDKKKCKNHIREGQTKDIKETGEYVRKNVRRENILRYVMESKRGSVFKVCKRKARLELDKSEVEVEISERKNRNFKTSKNNKL